MQLHQLNFRFLKSFRFLERFQNFGKKLKFSEKISDFQKNVRFSESQKISDFKCNSINSILEPFVSDTFRFSLCHPVACWCLWTLTPHGEFADHLIALGTQGRPRETQVLFKRKSAKQRFNPPPPPPPLEQTDFRLNRHFLTQGLPLFREVFGGVQTLARMVQGTYVQSKR